MLGRRRVAADEMAHVELGHLVVGQVVGLDAVLVHRAQQARGFAPIRDLDADKQVGDPGVARSGS